MCDTDNNKEMEHQFPTPIVPLPAPVFYYYNQCVRYNYSILQALTGNTPKIKQACVQWVVGWLELKENQERFMNVWVNFPQITIEPMYTLAVTPVLTENGSPLYLRQEPNKQYYSGAFDSTRASYFFSDKQLNQVPIQLVKYAKRYESFPNYYSN